AASCSACHQRNPKKPAAASNTTTTAAVTHRPTPERVAATASRDSAADSVSLPVGASVGVIRPVLPTTSSSSSTAPPTRPHRSGAERRRTRTRTVVVRSPFVRTRSAPGSALGDGGETAAELTLDDLAARVAGQGVDDHDLL